MFCKSDLSFDQFDLTFGLVIYSCSGQVANEQRCSSRRTTLKCVTLLPDSLVPGIINEAREYYRER